MTPPQLVNPLSLGVNQKFRVGAATQELPDALPRMSSISFVSNLRYSLICKELAGRRGPVGK